MNSRRIIALFIVLLCLIYSNGYGDSSNKYKYRDDEFHKQEEDEILKNKEKIGNRYWVIKNDEIRFYDFPDVLAKQFYVTSTESFVVQDWVPSKYSSTSIYVSYYKIAFDSGKTAYIEAYKLDEKDYIKTEDPKIIDEKRRQEIDKIFKEIGIYKGQSLWLKYPKSELPGLTKIKIKDYKFKDDKYLPSIKCYAEGGDRDVEIDFFYDDQPKYVIAQIRETFYIKDPSPIVSKWGKRVLTAIKKGKVFIGMNKEQVRLSWGLPQEINKSGGKWGLHEQWIYGDFGPYLYFENNKLTSWQD